MADETEVEAAYSVLDGHTDFVRMDKRKHQRLVGP
jgi:hypothetical protein